MLILLYIPIRFADRSKQGERPKSSIRYILYFFSPLIIVVLGLAAALAPILYQPASDSEARWVVETYRHKLTAAKAIADKKLLIMGGSGAYFGIRADVISQKNKIKAFNFASHAGLPFTFQSYMAKKVLNPGDSVLLALEYSYYGPWPRSPHGALQNSLMASVFLSTAPGYIFSLNPQSQVQLVRHISLHRIMDGWKVLINGEEPYLGYHADALNALGDENFDYRQLPGRRELYDATMERLRVQGLPYVAWKSEYLHSLRSFIEWCQKNDVKVYATWPNSIKAPPYTGKIFQNLTADVERFYKKYNVPVVGSVEKALISEDMILDTDMHPNLEGARLRSLNLALSLCSEAKICN